MWWRHVLFEACGEMSMKWQMKGLGLKNCNILRGEIKIQDGSHVLKQHVCHTIVAAIIGHINEVPNARPLHKKLQVYF